MLPCKLVLALETPVISGKNSVHMLPQASLHMLPQSSLLVLLSVCLSIHVLLRESMHMPLRAFILVVTVPHACLLFYPTHSCEVTLSMALENLMYKSGVTLVIPCIISRNIQNVDPCSGLLNKSAKMYLVKQNVCDNSLFSDTIIDKEVS